MKKTDKYYIMLKELDNPDNEYKNIINDYVIENKEISPTFFIKFTVNDEEFYKKWRQAKTKYTEYLITTYYMNPEYFEELIKVLSEQDLEYLIKYIERNKNKEIYQDIFITIEGLKITVEKKKVKK